MYNCSGAEATKFVQSVEDTVMKVKKLGLNPLKTSQEDIKAKNQKPEKKIQTITNPN